MFSSNHQSGCLSHKVVLFLLPLFVVACSAPLEKSSAPKPVQVPAELPSSNVNATTPNQEAIIEAQNTEQLRQDDESRVAKDAREQSLHLKLVQTMIDQDNAYAALAHLDAYDQKWGIDRISMQLRADSLRKTGQLDQAELIYKSMLGGDQETVKSGPVWYGLGKVSIERGDLRGAATRLEKAVQVDPMLTKAYSDLGLVYLLEGQKEPSYNTLIKASQLASSDSNVMTNLALWGLVFDDFNMAMDYADRLQWSDKTRNQVMSQANSIKRRFDTKGNAQ